MQHQSDMFCNSDFSRLERLRKVKYITWKQLGEILGLSVGMLMMVKSGKRKLSAKALLRLEEAEKSAGLRESGHPGPSLPSVAPDPSRVITALEEMENEAEIKLTAEDIERGNVLVRLRYRAGRAPKGFPSQIKLEAKGYLEAQVLLAAVKSEGNLGVVLIECFPKIWLKANLLDKLTPACVNAMMKAAASLVFGLDWNKK